jgi:hypothetical protein
MVLRMKKTMTGRQRRGRSMTSGGRRQTASATARFFEEGEAPGHRVLVQTAHATKEDEEAPRECFIGDEAPGRPAMARRQDPPGGGTYTKVEMGEGLGRGKRVQQGLSRDL